jgi:hypothetical protein
MNQQPPEGTQIVHDHGPISPGKGPAKPWRRAMSGSKMEGCRLVGKKR